MSRKVYVNVTTRIIMDVEEGVSIDDVIADMNYEFNPSAHMSEDVRFEDTEITGHEVTDSK